MTNTASRQIKRFNIHGRPSMRNRITSLYLQAECKREQQLSLSGKEICALSIARLFIKLKDFYQRLQTFHYASLGRGFHQISGNFNRGPLPTVVDDPELNHSKEPSPESWLTLPENPAPDTLISLPPPTPVETPIQAAITSRFSCRHFDTISLSTEEIATLLSLACGTAGENRYAFPAGGGLICTDIYLLQVKQPADYQQNASLAAGAYRYWRDEHGLEPISLNFPPTDIQQLLLSYRDFDQPPSSLLFITHTFSRNEKKYGEFGYRLGLLEAGHIGQNISLLASAMGLGCIALGIGNFDVGRINQLFAIDGVETTIVHTLALGLPKANACPQ